MSIKIDIDEIGKVSKSLDKDETGVAVTVFDLDTSSAVALNTDPGVATQYPASSGTWNWVFDWVTRPDRTTNYLVLMVGAKYGQVRKFYFTWYEDNTKFLNAVWIDTVNGTSGQGRYVGTPFRKSKVWSDAVAIIARLGLKEFKVANALTLGSAVTGIHFIGNSITSDIVTLNNQVLTGVKFTYLGLTGQCNGFIECKECMLENVTDINGLLQNSAIKTRVSVKIGGVLNGQSVFGNSIAGEYPIIDLQNSLFALVGIADFTGLVEIQNFAGGLILIGGNVLIKFHSSCTGGTAVVSGDRGELTIDPACTTTIIDLRNAGYSEQAVIDGIVDLIKVQTDKMNFTGTDIKATLDGELVGLIDDAITSAKFDETTAFPLKNEDSGATQIARTGADADTLETLSDQIDLVKIDTQFIKEVEGGGWTISGNQMIFYKTDNVTELFRVNLFKNGVASSDEPDKRTRV